MSSESENSFSQKQVPGTQPDPMVAQEIKKRRRDEMLPCAVAFEIAKELKVSPLDVGKTADLLDISLAKCQLGLFGYKPDKKIVKAVDVAPAELLAAIRAAMENERLTCEAAWKIADRFKITKLKFSSVCEGQKIKIKPCQLGAF